MTIKKRIQLYAAILLLCVGIVVGVFFVTDFFVQRSQNNVNDISNITRQTSRLYLLTQDYVKNPSLKKQEEWEEGYNFINTILTNPTTTTYNGDKSFQQLRMHSNTILALFVQIIQVSDNTEQRTRLANEILLHVRSFSDDSAKLQEAIFSQSEIFRQRSAAALFVLFEVLFAVVLSIAFYVKRNVSEPLEKLTEEIEEIGNENEALVVPADHLKDEVGILGNAFNRLLSRLSSQTKVLKEEKAKDKLLSRELDKRIVELERSRKAMSNLLDDFGEEQGVLAEAKAKDDALLENMGDAMFAVDMEKKIMVINKAAENALGLKRDEVLGKRYDEVFANQDADGNIIPPEKRPITQVLTTGLKFSTPNLETPASPATPDVSDALPSIPVFYVRADGSKFPVALIISPIVVDGKIVGAVDIFRDISKEQEIEKLRIDFLSLASHQLRTPLSGTKWLIETIRRGITGEVNPKQKEYLDQIYVANERMIALVYDMLDVLKWESSAVVIHKQKISIAELFNDVVQKIGEYAKKQKITIHSRLTENATLSIETDNEILVLIMECFCTNAVHYSKSGQEVLLDAKDEPTMLTISVKDSGIGIPKDEYDKIFERFYRASNAKQFIPEGTGLGLYRAKLLAEKIGAKLWFESEEGKGSIFYVSLPKHTA